MSFETLTVDTPRAGVMRLTLGQPDGRSPSSSQLLDELSVALRLAKADASVRCLLISGWDRAFAASADAVGRAGACLGALEREVIGPATGRLQQGCKPIIAAVAGCVMGKGCELAMRCDFIIAADTAEFGQPSVGLESLRSGGRDRQGNASAPGTETLEAAGAAGTVEAAQAQRAGLVSRVVPADSLLEEALASAARIAASRRWRSR